MTDRLLFFCLSTGCFLLQSCTGENTITHSIDDDSGAETAIADTPLPPPRFSLPPAGFYQKLTLPAPVSENGGTVRCTFDGTEPTIKTGAITQPIEITRNTVVNCYEFADNKIVVKATESYFIGEAASLPVVSIRVTPAYLQEFIDAEPCKPDPCITAKFWEDVEEPAHIEYFSEGSLSKGKSFEIDAGISIVGGYSRNNKKKSVAVTMRKKYQDGRLKYPLFSVRPENKKFKSFILRNNGNRYTNDYVSDAAGTSLVEGLVDYQRSKFVIVYYNGKYHGIFDLREKLNEHFVETNHGIDSKEVNFVEHKETAITANGGSEKSYVELLEYAGANDFSGAHNAAYEEIKKKLDIGNYADYMAAEIYYRNGDWPFNNVKAWNSSSTPWRFAVFDIDHGFDYSWNYDEFFSMSMFEWIRTGGKGDCEKSSSPYCFHNLFNKLITNSTFKRLFVNHAVIIYQSYVNAATTSIQISRKLQGISKKEMNRDQAEFPRNPDYVQNVCGITFDYNSSCTMQWAEKRDLSVREEFRKEFNLGVDTPVLITAEGGGHVLVDGMALPTRSYQGNFFANNNLLLLAVPDQGNRFVEWSDGNTENPREVKPLRGTTYTAIFTK